MKKKKLFLIILIVIITLMVIKIFIPLGLVLVSSLGPADYKEGLKYYNKNYYTENYGGDLNSGLYIFPDKRIVKDAEFYSSIKTNLFDIDGYIILKANYSDTLYNDEVDRLKNIKITINQKCESDSLFYINKIKYNDSLFKYPAYVSIDNCFDKYEYALLNEAKKEIYYIYLSHPNTNNKKYRDYLKKDKGEYSNLDSICNYSLYNHTFDNGKFYLEFDDCSK